MAKKQWKAKEASQQAGMPAASSAQLPEGFRAKKLITLPTLVMKEASEPRILRFDTAMRVSTFDNKKGGAKGDGGKRIEEPATVAAVTDMQSGEQMQFIVPSVVKANLEREYADNDYVLKIFRIQCLGKRVGKRYRDFSIMEVDQT